MTEMKRGGWLGLALILGTTVPAALAQQPTSPSYPVYKVTNTPAPAAASPAPASTPAPPPSAPAQPAPRNWRNSSRRSRSIPTRSSPPSCRRRSIRWRSSRRRASWRDTNNLAKLDAQPWDENVKAVARVPAVIQKMNDDLAWTIGARRGVPGAGQGSDGRHPDHARQGPEGGHAPDDAAADRDGHQHDRRENRSSSRSWW